MKAGKLFFIIFFVAVFVTLLTLVNSRKNKISSESFDKEQESIQTVDESNGIENLIIDKAKEEKRVRWACIGDSITDSATLGKSTKVFGDIIQNETIYDFTNLGCGGTGFIAGKHDHKNYSQRIDQVPRDTRVVTIFASLNDVMLEEMKVGQLNDMGGNSLFGQMNLVLSELYKINKYMVVGIITPSQWGEVNSHSKRKNVDLAERYVNAVKKFAQYNSLPVLDLYNESGLRAWDNEMVDHYYEEGMMHPDSFLQEIYYAPKIKSFLQYLGTGYPTDTVNEHVVSDFVPTGENDNIKEVLEEAKAGDIVKFGKNDWIVLVNNNNDNNEREAFLLSKNVIECKPYHNSRVGVTWINSDIRKYLNEILIDKLFTKSEKEKIVEKEYYNNDIETINTASFSSTKKTKGDETDKIALLSLTEYNALVKDKNYERANATETAYKGGVYISEEGFSNYWLRSTGRAFFMSAMVAMNTGRLEESGYYVDVLTYGLRPCITVGY